MGLLGDWKVTGITTDGAKISHPFYALANAIDTCEFEDFSEDDLRNIGNLFLECKQYFDLYFDNGIKKYKTDATKFLVQLASYMLRKDGKIWSWQEVRHLSQGLYESMEKSPAHFFQYNIPIINNIVAEINEFINKDSKPKISNEDLISVLTKDILPLLQKDWEWGEENFTWIHDGNYANTSNDDDSIIYAAEPSYSYMERSSGAVYGFIFTQIGYNDYTNVYLVRYKPSENKFRALFEFEYAFTEASEMRNANFKNIKITDVGGGLHKSLTYLANKASLNNYINPPPYVVFAQMIENN